MSHEVTSLAKKRRCVLCGVWSRTACAACRYALCVECLLRHDDETIRKVLRHQAKPPEEWHERRRLL